MTYTVETFLQKIKPYVIADMKSSGILASLTAAQALIESRHGESGLAIKGNNLFGIKGNYHGASVNMLTTEYYNGVAHKVYADFRKYPSWTESIADHSSLFNRLSRYKNLRGCTDYKQACKNVEKDGYATAEDGFGNPSYAKTLIATIEKHRLYEWDKEVMNSGVSSTSEILESLEDSNRNPYKEPVKAVRYNSRGNDVRWMQYALNKKGYHLVVDGIAGTNSINALRDFQIKNGLVADGICGEKSRAKLLS